jgi:hypothetical protein
LVSQNKFALLTLAQCWSFISSIHVWFQFVFVLVLAEGSKGIFYVTILSVSSTCFHCFPLVSPLSVVVGCDLVFPWRLNFTFHRLNQTFNSHHGAMRFCVRVERQTVSERTNFSLRSSISILISRSFVIALAAVSRGWEMDLMLTDWQCDRYKFLPKK